MTNKYTEELSNEIWKTIKDFPNYKISNFGNISNGKQIIKQRYNNSGYLIINLWKDRKPYTKTVHRLVALAFVENPNNYPEVNHIDGNKDNNNADNLEWCTRSQNCKHAFEHGLSTNPNPKALNPKQEKEAKFLYKKGASLKELEEIFHVSHDVIRKYVKFVYKQRPVSIELKNEIKRLYDTGLYTYKELCELFDVGTGTIGRSIKNNRA